VYLEGCDCGAASALEEIGRPAPVMRLALTVKEVALALGISETTVRALISSGRLPTVPGIGRAQRVPTEALRKYVNGEREQ
jgi:excisionase family DNA binding protein